MGYQYGTGAINSPSKRRKDISPLGNGEEVIKAVQEAERD
jgi:hypothetical protein